MIEEKWADIKGYEGFYKISNYGRVMSLKNKQNQRFPKIKKQLNEIEKIEIAI